MRAPKALLREGRPRDLEALQALLSSCLAEAWDAGSLRESLAAPGVSFHVIELQDGLSAGGLAGAVLLRSAGDDAEILQLAVDPGLRRRGLGRRLLRRAESRAIGDGAARLFLEVRPGNEGARALYERAGYFVLSRRKGYYRDGEDALVLSRSLSSSPRLS